MKKIVFTGGGSAGHVTPNIAIIPKLKQKGWEVEYIGSHTGIEKQIIESFGVPYHSISSGKLRRYFDIQNLKDPFKVVGGLFQSYFLLRKLKPQVVFSKGGFVSVPVIIGSWLNRIPVIIHESDMTPGLANKISIPFATKICVTFPETLEHFDSRKAVHTGSPIREEITRGDKQEGYQLCGFQRGKPVLLVTGGSLGAEKINRTIRATLTRLLSRFQVVHLCGKGHVDPALLNVEGYKQFEYVNQEMPDLLAMADIVISRAGSNSIFELLALKKPSILIPLSRQVSRGDQILNARSFEKMGYSHVLYEEDLSGNTLWEQLNEVYEQRDKFISRMNFGTVHNSVDQMVELIETFK